MEASVETQINTYLTFRLEGEDFAVDVSSVREILKYTSITKVPRKPDYMKGVINLRGIVVPVIDMRLNFGLPEAEATVDTCIIVMEVELDGTTAVIGAIADSVDEVFELEPEEIESPPRIGVKFSSEFILGMGKRNGNFIIILDVVRIFSTDDLIMAGCGGEKREGNVCGNRHMGGICMEKDIEKQMTG